MSVKPIKYKLKEAHHVPESHQSFAIISTDRGEFTGIAKCCKRDYEWESNYFGCELAEIRAGIKYMKIRMHEAKAKKKAMNDYYLMVCDMKGFDAHAPEMSKARRMIYTYNEEITDWKNMIASAYETIDMKCKLREKTMKKLKPRAN